MREKCFDRKASPTVTSGWIYELIEYNDWWCRITHAGESSLFWLRYGQMKEIGAENTVEAGIPGKN